MQSDRSALVDSKPGDLYCLIKKHGPTGTVKLLRSLSGHLSNSPSGDRHFNGVFFFFWYVIKLTTAAMSV